MIDIKEWNPFVVGELFTIARGKRQKAQDRIKGDTPYYSASNDSNGRTDAIGNPSFIDRDAIIGTTFGDFFYVKDEFSGSDEITIYHHPKIDGNEYIGLFVATLLRQNKDKYSFTTKMFMDRSKKDIIFLPITISKEPDWIYMENYMRAIETKVCAALSKLEKAKEVEAKWIDISGWGEFLVGDLFDAQRGKVKGLQTLAIGNIPVIAAARQNQGVAANYNVEPLYSEKITVSCNGVGCGSTFYHPYAFNINGDAIVLTELDTMSEKSKKFIACVLDSTLTLKYSYEEKCSATKAKEEVIKLPIDAQGNPDWQYMEDYMCNIETKVNNSLTKLLLC